MNKEPELKLQLEIGGNNAADNIESIINWESYTFEMDFLVPSNGFSLRVGQNNIDSRFLEKLKAGQTVNLFGVYQDDPNYPKVPIASGQIDQLSISTSRGGSFIDIRGRNFLGIICDSQLDPWDNRFKFDENTTLAQAMSIIFSDFGIKQIILTNDKNRSLLTGRDKTKVQLQTQVVKTSLGFTPLLQIPISLITTTTVEYDPTKPELLRHFNTNLQSIKPHFGETYYAFAERLCKRFGLHIWGNAQGNTVIIGKPEYNQEALYIFKNTKDGIKNNILSSSVTLDYSKLPQLIVSKGYGGGKAKSADISYIRLKTAKTNDFLIDPDNPSNMVKALLASHPGLELIPSNDNRRKVYSLYGKYFSANITPRVVYDEDHASKTTFEIENFISRKMSEYQRDAFKVQLTVQDHMQGTLVYSIDTIAIVNDETLGINAPFYIEKVVYRKSRAGGTVTDLTLVPLYSMEFGVDD